MAGTWGDLATPRGRSPDLTDTEGTKLQVANREYNRKVDEKIPQIQSVRGR